MHAAKRAQKITGAGGKDKVVVMGMLERGGRVRASVVENRRRKEVQSQVREHIEAGSAIFSDELKSYEGLHADYQHAVINHAIEYVNGNIHTNGMMVATGTGGNGDRKRQTSFKCQPLSPEYARQMDSLSQRMGASPEAARVKH